MKLVFKEDILIQNENFIIRKFKEADTNNMYQLLSNEKVMEFIEKPFDYIKTLEFMEKYALTDFPIVFSIKKNNEREEFLGYLIFKPYDDISYEIGWLLNEKHWGKGYASDITKELIEYAKINGIKKLVIEFDENQQISEKIAIKSGFCYEYKDENLIVYTKKLEY